MKFRRKQSASTEPEEAVGPPEDAVAEGGVGGPYDVADIDPEAPGRVDLGSLVVPPFEGHELRMQVDEASQQVQGVMYTGPDGALELRAFAAPRNGDLWGEVRGQIRDDMTGRGATVEEREGRFGPELVCELPVTMPDGKSGIQPSRIIGVNGPRWFLRATLMGAPAKLMERAGPWEDTLSEVAVRRGTEAMPPGEALPLVLPAEARRVR